MKDYLYIDSNDDAHQAKFKVSDTPKIDYLIKEKRFDEALDEINQLLKSNYTSDNLNLKGIILDNLSQHKESIEFFDKSLSENYSNDVQLNKANALYHWAKITFFPEGDHEKALKLIDCALENIPDNEDPSEFYFLKAEILEGLNDLVEAQKAYLIAYKEFDRLKELEYQIEYLKSTDDILINIVGSSFYDFTPKRGDLVELVKDENNEHDPDAIAVVRDGKTVGYVANNPYTLIDEVKSASSIVKSMNEMQKAEIIFIYLGEYVLAKLL